jgi:phage virion morphogenesis protein
VSELVFSVADVVGHDSLGRRHAGRRRRLQDIFGKLPAMRVAQLLDIVGSEVESQTRRRLGEEKQSPDGEAWASWSPAYAARRPGKGGLLELEGHLLDSVTYNVERDEVQVGSNLAYAGVHQKGSKDGDTPARAYLGLSTENAADVQALVLDFIEREMLA